MFTVLHVTFVLLYHAAAGLILRRRTCVHKSYAPALRLSSLNASCCFSSVHFCVLSLHSLRVRARAVVLARASVLCLRVRVRVSALHITHSSFLLSFNLHTLLRFTLSLSVSVLFNLPRLLSTQFALTYGSKFCKRVLTPLNAFRWYVQTTFVLVVM
jgi:hypothetical protein